MRLILLLVTLSLCWLSPVKAHTLEEFAKFPQFLDIKISPKGTYLAGTSRNDTGNIILTVINIATNEVISIKQFTGRESIGSFNWANDERLLLTLVREIGSLESPQGTGEIYAVNADGSRPMMLVGPRSSRRELSIFSVINYLPDEDDFVLVASSSLTAARGSYILVHRLNINNGRTRQVARAPLRSNPGEGVQMITDGRGVARMAVGVDQNNDNESILMYRANERADWRELRRYPYTSGGFIPLGFLSDNTHVVGLSDTQTDTRAISILNPDDGTETILAYHPRVDVSPIISIRNGFSDEVIGASYDFMDIEAVFFDDVRNKEFSAIIQGLINALPGRAVSITSTTRDNSKLVVRVESANATPDFYLFDSNSRQLAHLLNSMPWIDQSKLPQAQAIVYKSRDGLDIHAILTLPPGKEAKDLPLIMLPHGGPHGPRDMLSFNPRSPAVVDAKVFASHGYAVLQPNFRGSGGFGRSFEQAGHRNWGTTMIDDMTDGVLHLVEQGIVNKGRVCAYGASYGGYAALMSAVREPDLYQCTVGFVGLYDLNTMFEVGDIPQRQSGINYLELVLGRDKAQLDAQSPQMHLDKLKAPVFLIHGAEDRRTPLSHATGLRAELDKRNHPYEWLVKEREGHGFYNPENEVERWQRMLAFFERYIGTSAAN
ncbi:S9 family peptidase [Alkalimonas sp. MEB108]|uniref:S9 family peptidase n=1 Tax=Alkalimonas cellulosilytica TaxID=3058395 RepID=A0ABU7J8I9_9GAMM|nr:S9 family peptidase [Alkalimonas sp. MEB108]MEE2002672.1 S9 family peptidase [Alkalimonas sp. MEB108]